MAPSTRSEAVGIAVPLDEARRRSTSTFAKTVLAEAIGESNPEAAAAVLAESEWRSGYHKHFVAATEAGIASPTEARGIASRGLAAVSESMRYVREGHERSLAEVMSSEATNPPFDTHTIPGRSGPLPRFTIPYRGIDLGDDDLRGQLERWVAGGVIEVSAAAALEEVLDNPDWLDLSDLTFVVMGAGAELGPYPALMGLGATVAAIDLPVERIWDRLMARAGGRSALLCPTRDGFPGADLTTDLPEIRDWINTIEGPIVLGGYAYADGEAHLRVSAAQDALIADAFSNRTVGSVTVAHLLTPTDCYAVSEHTAEASRRAWARRPRSLRIAQGAARTVSGGRLFHQAITDC
ncbi:MAG: hypothetical protein ACN4GZ_10960, partial [Acidimicrobiales bacterium]